jgi:hypothetical protein
MMHSHRNGVIPPYCQKRNSSLPVCRFRYPKAITPQTSVDAHGNVHYRRRNEEDRMVVPYNMELIRRYKCHINFEVAGTSHLFQYLFKYIHKGNILKTHPFYSKRY